MDFSLSAEQEELRSQTSRFARTELNESMLERDSSESFDRSLWRSLAEHGLLRAIVPPELGGDGRDVFETVLMMEGFGHGCVDNGLALAVTGHVWTVVQPILGFGTETQKAKYLPGMASGDLIGAHAITEPEAGSDSYSMTTTATPSDEGFVLNGRKTLIGMGPVCDVALVFAKTNPERGRWGISAFLLDAETAGFERGEQRSKLGLRTNPIGDLIFNDCWVPKDAMLGPEGAGLSISAESLEWERSFIFAAQVGAMRRQLEETIEYASSRQQFGRPIGDFQSVSNRIADMKLRLDVAQLLLFRSAWLKASGSAAALESALTKLHIAESFLASSLDAVRIHGGVGYLTEFGVDRNLRDAVGGVIYGGTSDIQRQVIARHLGLRGSS